LFYFIIMPTVRSILVSVSAGAMVSGGWWALADGIIISDRNGLPFWWYYAIPAIGATFCAILLNMFRVEQLGGSGDVVASFSGDDIQLSTWARVWVFFWLLLAVTFIGGALWVAIARYAYTKVPWAGAALVLCTFLSAVAGALFFGLRR
jgi:Uncharacterised protein family (UPF0220)